MVCAVDGLARLPAPSRPLFLNRSSIESTVPTARKPQVSHGPPLHVYAQALRTRSAVGTCGRAGEAHLRWQRCDSCKRVLSETTNEPRRAAHQLALLCYLVPPGQPQSGPRAAATRARPPGLLQTQHGSNS